MWYWALFNRFQLLRRDKIHFDSLLILIMYVKWNKRRSFRWIYGWKVVWATTLVIASFETISISTPFISVRSSFSRIKIYWNYYCRNFYPTWKLITLVRTTPIALQVMTIVCHVSMIAITKGKRKCFKPLWIQPPIVNRRRRSWIIPLDVKHDISIDIQLRFWTQFDCLHMLRRDKVHFNSHFILLIDVEWTKGKVRVDSPPTGEW